MQPPLTFLGVHPVDRVKFRVDGVGELKLGELRQSIDDVLNEDLLRHVLRCHDVEGYEGGIH